MKITRRNGINLQVMQNVVFSDLGRMDYLSAWKHQEVLLQANVRSKSQRSQLLAAGSNQLAGDHDVTGTTHHLLLVEHPPVYTLGKSGRMENILISDKEMELMGIEFYHTNRAGDITFHGPGQVVAYPILDLERFYSDIGRYLRNLEEVVIRTIAEYGLTGERSPGETGVWLQPQVKGLERKICAMGVRCSRWITMHGLALNVNTNLEYFEHVIPCGIQDKKVTSIEHEIGTKVPLDKVKESIKRNFEEVFDVTLV